MVESLIAQVNDVRKKIFHPEKSKQNKALLIFEAIDLYFKNQTGSAKFPDYTELWSALPEEVTTLQFPAVGNVHNTIGRPGSTGVTGTTWTLQRAREHLTQK